MLFVYYLIIIFSNSELSLNGKWIITNSNHSIEINGNVPGQVHLDLLKNKIIEDPYFNDHVLEETWVAWENWEYSTEFEINSEIISSIN